MPKRLPVFEHTAVTHQATTNNIPEQHTAATYAAGSVTGPVVAAVQTAAKDTSLRLLPDAEAPAGV
jgi:hypothetical protein